MKKIFKKLFNTRSLALISVVLLLVTLLIPLFSIGVNAASDYGTRPSDGNPYSIVLYGTDERYYCISYSTAGSFVKTYYAGNQCLKTNKLDYFIYVWDDSSLQWVKGNSNMYYIYYISFISSTETLVDPEPETHTHYYNVSIYTYATCTEAGVKKYLCTCGDSYYRSYDALGHNFQNGVCIRCSEVGNDSDPPADGDQTDSVYVDFLSMIFSPVQALFSITIFETPVGSVSIGSVFYTVVGIVLFLAFLKFFGGK